MNFSLTLVGIASVLVAGCNSPRDATKADSPGADRPMTLQQCKEHMAMSPAGAKKTDAHMRKDALCADLLKRESAAISSGDMGEGKRP